jgi:predicted N-acetyltransferase YhbS
MITLRQERAADIPVREALLDQAFGAARRKKTSERLREGRRPADGLGFVATDGSRVVGTARLWQIACASGQRALLLGPVAVAGECRDRGIGAALVRHALREARRRGHGAVILVGDSPYYSRFGFSGEKTGALKLPGPFERDRLLALELVPAALEGARGLIRATGIAARTADSGMPAQRHRRGQGRQSAPRAA